jgi:hypothetical protein
MYARDDQPSISWRAKAENFQILRAALKFIALKARGNLI